MRLFLIALWDLAARVRGEPLNSLLGDLKRPAYASLLRIGDPTLVANECETQGNLLNGPN
jgi:L-alanine-DL-glutamate epimerase-like enolase superfamily enzyme